MPTPIFQPYVPGVKETLEQKVKNLLNAYTENMQQLQWLMSHLDEKNVVRAKSVIADWVYAGDITANQINVTGGKIQDSQIDSADEWNADISSLQNFVDVIYPADINGLQSQIDGNITTWFYAYEPTLLNLPASDWATDEIKNNHLGDLFYDTSTGYAYRFALSGNYQWIRITDTDITTALANAAAAQDTADSKRRVFVAQPAPPYDVGDLWTQGSTGDLMKCKTQRLSGSYNSEDWELATRYTDDTALADFISGTYATNTNNLQSQIDGKIETYYTGTDPNTWAEGDRAKHTGDIWYNTTTKLLKRYNGTSNAWELIEDQKAIDAYANAAAAQDTADGKRRIFTSQPTVPYDIGDLWVQGSEGDIMVCQTPKTQGQSYDAGDWIKSSKYTDDSALESFVSGVYASDKASLQSQIDGNITSWFYDGEPTLLNQPASNWTTDAQKDVHLGDLYYDNLTGYAYRFRHTTVYEWFRITDTDVTLALANAAAAQDTADSKRRVFVAQPAPPYDVGDLWAGGAAADLKICVTAKTEGQSYAAGDWELATNAVAQDTLYNRVKITPTDGIQIFDESNVERYKAGDLGGGIYGMYLKNTQGIKTVSVTDNGNILNGINESVTYYIKNTQAHYVTTCPNANSNLIIFAKADGIAGTYTYIRYVDPGVSTPNISVTTTGSGTAGDPYYITVTLKHNGSAVTATAKEIAFAINYLDFVGHPNIWADLIANVNPSDGTGVVAAFGYQQLTGYSQGSDSNDGLTVDTPLLTLNRLWEIIPSEINDTVTIKYLTGHYNVSSGNTISSKYGTGKILFQPYTNSYVTIGNAEDGWDISQCTLSLISFSYMCIRGRMDIQYVNNFNVDHCKCYMASYLYNALSFSNVNSAIVESCSFTDYKTAIYSYLSTVLSNTNTGETQNPLGILSTYGLYARAGTIFKNGTQPVGGSANEFTDYGGEIR
jgi:phage-related protein